MGDLLHFCIDTATLYGLCAARHNSPCKSSRQMKIVGSRYKPRTLRREQTNAVRSARDPHPVFDTVFNV